MSETINPALAYATIARIAAQIANAEVSVEVTKKPPHDATEKGEKHDYLVKRIW